MLRHIVFIYACVVALAFTSQVALSQSPTTDIQKSLEPTGILRVGLVSGDATQSIKDSTSGELSGVGLELGKELAKRAGFSFEAVLYPSIGKLLDGGKAGAWDVSFIGVTPGRERDWDLTVPHMEFKFCYLVPSGSSIGTLGDVDKAGIRVAVQERSGPEAFASRALKNARLVRAPDYVAILEMQKSGRADAIFSLKPILFELSGQMPGSRVLDGAPGTVPQAMAMPKGRNVGLTYARKFIDAAKSEGVVEAAVEKAGVRGVIVPADRMPSR
jgi:polar amino acid transport system substrate-binding protein